MTDQHDTHVTPTAHQMRDRLLAVIAEGIKPSKSKWGDHSVIEKRAAAIHNLASAAVLLHELGDKMAMEGNNP